MLPVCGCDQNARRSPVQPSNRPNLDWHWAGCSHDLAFGERLSRDFSNDIASVQDQSTKLLTIHNNEAGRRVRLLFMVHTRWGHIIQDLSQISNAYNFLLSTDFAHTVFYLQKNFSMYFRGKIYSLKIATFKINRSGRKNLRKCLYDGECTMKYFEAVRRNLEFSCKCHGVSGSCTTKICWRKLKPFSAVGRSLYKNFEYALRVRYFEKRKRLRPAFSGLNANLLQWFLRFAVNEYRQLLRSAYLRIYGAYCHSRT